MRTEDIAFDPAKINGLRKLVAQGEGHQLEFKRKATHPDKIVRELIAFANTDGGTLLVGVDDDRSIPGLKFPEEESVAISDELKKHCRPALPFEEIIIPLSSKKFVLVWTVAPSEKRPHFFIANGERVSFIRQKDQSIKASREMCEILRRRRSKNGTRFTYGDAEQKIFRFLEQQPTISMREVSHLTGLNRFLTARKLVRLVLANVLRIIPTEKGDLFSRVADQG